MGKAGDRRVTAEPPPEVAVNIVGGRLRIFGLTEAARYVGLSDTSVRRMIMSPESHSKETRERVFGVFPAFRDVAKRLKRQREG